MRNLKAYETLFTGMIPVQGRCTGLIGTVVIDAEEDFDWNTPIQGTENSTAHMKNVRVLGPLLAAFRIVPSYLLTYPVLEDPDVVAILRRQLDKGQCVLGVQLHSWVTPLLDGSSSNRHSFLGNLEANLEEKKLVTIKMRFRQAFGFDPIINRAGRYGLSRHTSHLLEKHGFCIDTSVAPRTNFAGVGGCDYTDYDCSPFWFGKERTLLEIPLCRAIVGWGGKWASKLYQYLTNPRLSQLHAPSVLTRSRCAERVTLSPEGNDVPAMHRLIDGLRTRGQQVFTLSFHSSSLEAGRNPYVQSRADLHGFYDRMSAILDYMVTDRSIRFVGTEDIPGILIPPASRAA